MSLGTLYAGAHSRSILPAGLVREFNLDIKVSAETDEAYNRAFPLQKWPTFIGPKGFKLSESLAVNLYNSKLLGKDTKEYAQIIQWASLANTEFLPNIAFAFKSLLGRIPYNKKSVTDTLEYVNKVADILEARLTDYTYLVGERISFADLYVASLSFRGFEHLFGSEWRAKRPNFSRWFSTVIAHPILAPNFTDFKFAEKPVEYQAPKKEKAPKQQAPKAAPKAEEEEPKPVEEKKPKHPLELLGKSTKFNLDEWKRTYSNEETRETALPWFWEHYDPSEWSLWKVDYKYNDELTLTFMSNNLLGGFFNRLSGSTKYLFGSGVVYGENNNNGIVGVFLIRGDKHEPAFDVAPDWESYEFTKLDASNPETKEFIDDIFAWDKPIKVNGELREVADGKVFK
ncbi:hypothetical protein WICMUC_001024 [Wickerhamomyces mucosus]|uniref:Elongation factor 1-gamma 1 n=1 Tax=Wickerhamomyces mucosus TaxID=1378264 RepID=A0A9P8PY32_9ASCO|nr:hypothetical protein WICMUC_001024 [Wickerhamomyces mucosus]